TPVPNCRPEGSSVSWVFCAPGWRRTWYIRSWNSARSRLKPVVETLAKLLEMVVRFMSWADRPVLLTHRAGSMECSPSSTPIGAAKKLAELHDLGHRRGIILGGTHHLDVQFELAGQGKH